MDALDLERRRRRLFEVVINGGGCLEQWLDHKYLIVADSMEQVENWAYDRAWRMTNFHTGDLGRSILFHVRKINQKDVVVILPPEKRAVREGSQTSGSKNRAP